MIERFSAKDFETVLSLVDSKRVARPLIGFDSFHRLRLSEWLRQSDQAEASGQVGLYVMRAKSGAVIGLVGFLVLEPKKPDEFYLIYAVNEAAEGQGLATASCGEVLNLARARGLKKILATVDSQNLASVRVLTKLGFKFIGMTAGELGELRLCELDL